MGSMNYVALISLRPNQVIGAVEGYANDFEVSNKSHNS